MYPGPHPIWVARFVCQSAPALAIVEPGSACGIPQAQPAADVGELTAGRAGLTGGEWRRTPLGGYGAVRYPWAPHTGQAPSPPAAYTFSATAICAARDARSARGA